MSEYEEQLNTFSVAETRDETKLYFEKYWLASTEYWEKWLPIQQSVFDESAQHLPDLMFRPDFELFPLIGGNIFTSEQDFEMLKNCMEHTGDEYFTVVQNKNVVTKVYYGEHGEDDWRIHPLLRSYFRQIFLGLK